MVVLSKENYIAIAAILKASTTKDEIMVKLIGYFKENNPAFDVGKFIVALGRVSPFREAMGRAVELNQELEGLVLVQDEKTTYWILIKSIRGLWELIETETDRTKALQRGEQISSMNPGKEVWVLLRLQGFREVKIERIP